MLGGFSPEHFFVFVETHGFLSHVSWNNEGVFGNTFFHAQTECLWRLALLALWLIFLKFIFIKNILQHIELGRLSILVF